MTNELKSTLYAAVITICLIAGVIVPNFGLIAAMLFVLFMVFFISKLLIKDILDYLEIK